MNIAINGTTYARQITKGLYEIVEDRNFLMSAVQSTFSFDCISMLDLYQQHFEVLQCLRKTTVRSTYEMLMNERNKLQAEIERRINAHN